MVYDTTSVGNFFWFFFKIFEVSPVQAGGNHGWRRAPYPVDHTLDVESWELHVADGVLMSWAITIGRKKYCSEQYCVRSSTFEKTALLKYN